jgi:hypothetical protein
MIDWNIQGRAQACQACEAAFTDRQPYYTVLCEERAGYFRKDICAACWEKEVVTETREAKGYVSHWQGVYEVPAPQPDPIRKETAESLLRKLLEAKDPRHEGACFILAVMLERKRVLRVKGLAQQDSRRVFIYEHPASGDVFTVADPDLKLDQLEEVQRDVGLLLSRGVEGASEASPPASPVEASMGGASTPPASSPTAATEVTPDTDVRVPASSTVV